MILSDYDIRQAMKDGYIDIDPFHEQFVQPASVDVHLSSLYRISRMKFLSVIDPSKEQALYSEEARIPEYVDVLPGDSILVSTLERIWVSRGYAARVMGRSSMVRLGVSVSLDAGWIDPGYDGQVTLLLTNHNLAPFRVYAGMKIAQVVFMNLETSADIAYGDDVLGSSYQSSFGPVPPSLHKKWKLHPEVANA